MQLLAELDAVLLDAAALEHQGIGDHIGNQLVAVVFCAALAALHRLPCFLAFWRGGGAVVIEHPASCRGINDPALQLFRASARQEHMQHRIVGAGLAGGIAHLLIAAAPAIANPHHHLLVRGRRWFGVRPGDDRPLDLGLPLQQANRLEFLLELKAEALLTLVGDFGGVVANRLALLLKQPLPLGTFCGLQAVFLQARLIAHLHQGAVFCHRLQQAGDLIAQGAAVLAQIRHH